MVELSTNENTYNAELVPTVEEAASGVGQNVYVGVDDYRIFPDVAAQQYGSVQSVPSQVVPSYSSLLTENLVSKTPTIAKAQVTFGKKVLSLDVETTGLNPWDYKMIVCSVWDLDEPKAAMRTFAGWDEEKICREMFAYIESLSPDVILAFNAKFECRCFITRAMLYHIHAPWIWTSEWHDMLAILEGGWKNGLTGTMPAGSEENWLKFFFNETKPFTIEECFEGIREGRLDEMIIRNRTCVQGQGDMYQLLMYCQQGADSDIAIEKPSIEMIDDVRESGISTAKCDVCGAVNEITDISNPGQCWRCSGNLPKLSEQNILKEVARPVDWSLVGLSGDKLKEAKATAKKSKTALELQPTGESDYQKVSMARLVDLAIKPHVTE